MYFSLKCKKKKSIRFVSRNIFRFAVYPYNILYYVYDRLYFVKTRLFHLIKVMFEKRAEDVNFFRCKLPVLIKSNRNKMKRKIKDNIVHIIIIHIYIYTITGGAACDFRPILWPINLFTRASSITIAAGEQRPPIRSIRHCVETRNMY